MRASDAEPHPRLATVATITVSLYRADTETWLVEETVYTTSLPDEAMGIQIATNSNSGAVASAWRRWRR